METPGTGSLSEPQPVNLNVPQINPFITPGMSENEIIAKIFQFTNQMK